MKCCNGLRILIFSSDHVVLFNLWLTFDFKSDQIVLITKSKLRGVLNLSSKSIWRRICNVLAYASNVNFSAFSSHFIFSHFLLETPVTWQNVNFSAFSNNCDLTFSKLIFHSMITRYLWLIIVDEKKNE